MKFKIVTLSMLIAGSSFSQETTSSAGQELSNSQMSINFTVGEPIISTLTTADGQTILNGYQQPFIKIETISIEETENWNVNVFPNPSQDYVNIKWDHSIIDKLEYTLYSIEGKIIMHGKKSELFSINISDLAAGNYFLNLSNSDKVQSYKIQKIK